MRCYDACSDMPGYLLNEDNMCSLNNCSDNMVLQAITNEYGYSDIQCRQDCLDTYFIKDVDGTLECSQTCDGEYSLYITANIN